MIHALVHTQGVVVGHRYIVLEMAYKDVTGFEHHCLVKSPLSFGDAKRIQTGLHSDVFMTRNYGTDYSSLLVFLCNQKHRLQTVLKTRDVVFGYKGQSYQPKILRDAGFAHSFNVETIRKIPSLKMLLETDDGGCPFHTRPSLKCARRAVRFVWDVLHQ